MCTFPSFLVFLGQKPVFDPGTSSLNDFPSTGSKTNSLNDFPSTGSKTGSLNVSSQPTGHFTSATAHTAEAMQTQCCTTVEEA